MRGIPQRQPEQGRGDETGECCLKKYSEIINPYKDKSCKPCAGAAEGDGDDASGQGVQHGGGGNEQQVQKYHHIICL